MLDEIKEKFNDKKTSIISIVCLLVIGIACWGMFSGGIPSDGGAINQVRAELGAAREQLDAANRKLAESQSISEELRRTNTEIRTEVTELTRENNEARELVNSLRSTNSDLAEQINRSANLNSENLRLVRDSQQGLKTVRETGERGN